MDSNSRSQCFLSCRDFALEGPDHSDTTICWTHYHSNMTGPNLAINGVYFLFSAGVCVWSALLQLFVTSG